MSFEDLLPEEVKAEFDKATQCEENEDHRRALSHLSQAESLLHWKYSTKPINNCELENDQWGRASFVELEARLKWRPLLEMERRLMNKIVGPIKSDDRISVWRQHKFDSTDIHPPDYIGYAWARHGDYIYRHGGYPLTYLSYDNAKDDLYRLHIETKKWEKVVTSNNPGGRCRHSAFVYKNGFYIVGGYGKTFMDMKVHKLDLDTLVWTVLKIKGIKPDSRVEMSCFISKDKVYIHGGAKGANPDFMNDLWCLDMSSLTWSQLSSGKGCVRRALHAMWVANNQVFIYGGETCKEGENPMGGTNTISIRRFQCFDLKTSKWSSLRCVGDDPWNNQETCMIPVFRNDQNHNDLQSVIIIGGYQQGNSVAKKMHKIVRLFGEEAQEYSLPYRKRVSRYDVASNFWTNLCINRRSQPHLAQCFGTVVKECNGIVELLVGGGYGITHDASSDLPTMMMEPKITNSLCSIEIKSGVTETFAERANKKIGWEWDVWKGDRSKKIIPYDWWVGSRGFFNIPFISEEDLMQDINLAEIAVDKNDEGCALGRRVIIHGLNKNTTINGKIVRCGPWLEKRERYCVFVREGTKVEKMSIRASNLKYAPPLLPQIFVQNNKNHLQKLLSGGVSCTATWVTKADESIKRTQLDLQDIEVGSKVNVNMDIYRGPFSAKGLAILEYCSKRNTKLPLQAAFNYCPQSTVQSFQDPSSFYKRHVTKLREIDEKKVQRYQKNLIKKRDDSKWASHLRLRVSIDCMVPPIERELIVSPQISLAALHHQVLCPAIGFSTDKHAYAFRRSHRSIIENPEDEYEVQQKAQQDEMLFTSSLREECWIGPRKSTAIDIFFMPFYIGGAFADDRKILLGDLYYTQGSKRRPDLQYIYDLGNWWSHSIRIDEEKNCSNVSVAELVSGVGGCPPDNVGGVVELMNLQRDLLNLSPKKDEWWEKVFSDIRTQDNKCNLSNPFTFDLKQNQESLKHALIYSLPKRGGEYRSVLTHSTDLGVAMAAGISGRCAEITDVKEDNPLKYCAVCKVTAGLKICAGCKSIAFCGRKCQLEYWPYHKAACKAAKKNIGKS